VPVRWKDQLPEEERMSERSGVQPSSGWNVAAIEPDNVQTRYRVDGAPAWLATIKRI
jgi:hypothetical protein